MNAHSPAGEYPGSPCPAGSPETPEVPGPPAAPGREPQLESRRFFNWVVTLAIVAIVAVTLLMVVVTAKAAVNDVPIGGFQPWVAFTLTDEFSNENQDDLFFVADVDSSFNASRSLPSPGSPIYKVGLLDSGAQVSLLQWQTMLDFDLPGTGFTGTEFIPAVGVGGTEFLRVEDPLGIFTAGLQNATAGSGGAALTVSDTTTLRGLKSNAPATAPIDSALPNVVGLPMMSTHTTVIRNSLPQFVESEGTTYRAPSIEFLPLGAPIPGDFTRRAALSLDVNATFGTTEPLYVFNVNNILSGAPLHEDPSTPTAVGGAFFTDLQLSNNGVNQNAEVFFDTGAQVTVVNELLAAQLGFDVVLDTPEFTVPILGVGGTITEVPGFTVDSLTLPAVGGNFTATDVPVIVLTEIPNPLGSGILDGILGTNVFWDRDLVVDPNGSRLWISDPVTVKNTSNVPANASTLAQWGVASSWSTGSVPTGIDLVCIHGTVSVDELFGDAVASRVEVSSLPGQSEAVLSVAENGRLTAFYDVNMTDGVLLLWDQSELRAGTVRIGESGRLVVARLGNPTARIVAEFENAGTVEAGFAVEGSYVQERDGSLKFFRDDANYPTSIKPSGSVVVSGLATLDGTLNLNANSSLLGDMTVPIVLYESLIVLSADDGINGVFSQVDGVNASPAGSSFAITYESDRVMLTLALIGDANLNQQVEQGDLDAVLSNWGQSNFDADDTVAVSWVTGDLTGDGFVNQGDLNAVLTNWGGAAAPDLRGLTVPEPAAAVVGLLLATLRSRPRRRRFDGRV